MAKRILDVGQCGVDGPRIGRFLRDRLQAHVDRAETLDDAVQQIGEHDYNLVLVNRVLNADGSSGLDVIAAVRKASPDVKVMLVSDHADAQKKAVGLGALPGFGKAALETVETEKLLEAAMGA
jgi:DNA-binding response OmpR family regulator